MARKLKVFQTSLGFFDLAIAAHSMKAALEAWGADSNLFHQGAARESKDPDIVTATMDKPGVVLRRPVGSDGPFREHAELPTRLDDVGRKRRPNEAAKNKKTSARTIDAKADRVAALLFEREQTRRERERKKEQVAKGKERARRQRAIDKAQEALNRAKRTHEERTAAIDAEREALDERSRAEEARWERGRAPLEKALRRARET